MCGEHKNRKNHEAARHPGPGHRPRHVALRTTLLSLSLFLALSSAVGATSPPADYNYPIADPLKATVAGAPGETALDGIPVLDRYFHVTIFPDRRLPPRFRNLRSLPFGLAAQSEPAPLIFIIAGTGSGHDAGGMKRLRNIFYRAGFHVVSLGSPFTRRFAASASTSSIPGIAMDDARDLYRAMQQIQGIIEEREVPVTGYHLTGYSLGGFNAAFIAHLDEKEGIFDFRRVLLMNPPVNLLESSERFDAFVERNVAGRADRFLDGLMEKMSAYFQNKGRVSVDDKFLYEIETISPLTSGELEGLIGIVFRLSLADVLFASDMMNGGGHVLRPGTVLRVGDSTTPFFRTCLRWTFGDYAREVVLPFWRKRHPGADMAHLRSHTDLALIADFLRRADPIGLVHNADDIILKPGDIAFLKDLFGERATIYPNGGHLGNMFYKPNIDHMLRFFQKKENDL